MKVNILALFRKFKLDKIKLNAGMFQAEIALVDSDKNAAWELYVEMLTRIITQELPQESGDEKAALESIQSLFCTTRTILRQHGRATVEFSKVAIPVLNQVVRPFTAKWHKRLYGNVPCSEDELLTFRAELKILQTDLRQYSKMLAEIAGVEDLTDMEREKDVPSSAAI